MNLLLTSKSGPSIPVIHHNPIKDTYYKEILGDIDIDNEATQQYLNESGETPISHHLVQQQHITSPVSTSGPIGLVLALAELLTASLSPTKLLSSGNNSLSHAYKTTPFISVTSLDLLSSNSSLSSSSSSSCLLLSLQSELCAGNSEQAARLNEAANAGDIAKFPILNKLKKSIKYKDDGFKNIFIIDNVQDALTLLNFYYSRKDNKLPSVGELFPYLHGLNNVKQRIFFDPQLNEDAHINEQLANSLNLSDFEVDNFTDKVAAPILKIHFYLSFVSSSSSLLSSSSLSSSSSTSNSLDNASCRLINTILARDLVQSNQPNSLFSSLLEDDDYDNDNKCKPFSHINNILPHTSGNSHDDGDLNNRNFKSQILLAAPFSNFLVYNPENNFGCNLKVAKQIEKSMDKNSNQCIFILNVANWRSEPGFQPFLEKNSEQYQSCSDLTDTPEIDTRGSKLLMWEQKLIWKLNSMKWINENICMGTTVDFNKISKENSGKNFQLYINCHQNASFPELIQLNDIVKNIERMGEDSYEFVPVYLKFPSSGSLCITTITFEETLCYLNVLKIIELLAIKNQKAFIFCPDGFTGLSLLSISIAYILNCNTQDNKSIENTMLNLVSDLKKDIRFYFFKNDLIFLKNLEKFIRWVHFDNIFYNDSMKTIDHQLILEMDYKKVTCYSVPQEKSLDWFNLEKDNNFPSRILNSLYLGSLNHASSATLLNAFKITRIVSLGEKPIWLNHLRDLLVLEHEIPDAYQSAGAKSGYFYHNNKKVKVIKPVYTYKFVKIYVIDFTSPELALRITSLPCLKKIIYIHNLKDDGKDSILPLLTKIPKSVRNELLINPLTSEETTFIHCRIGVSRSASLVIATLMKYLNWLMIKSYMFVRVKRFNIIIQPNLRLLYELFLYEEYLNRGTGSLRKLTWESTCHEIFKINNHYVGNA